PLYSHGRRRFRDADQRLGGGGAGGWKLGSVCGQFLGGGLPRRGAFLRGLHTASGAEPRASGPAGGPGAVFVFVVVVVAPAPFSMAAPSLLAVVYVSFVHRD